VCRLPFRTVVFNLGVATPCVSFAFFLVSRELLMKIFILTSILYISYVETLFVVAKIIGSPGTNDILLFYAKVF